MIGTASARLPDAAAKRGGCAALALALAIASVLPARAAATAAGTGTDFWWREWTQPDRSYRPRVRWGWPGNAITPAGIDRDLRALADKGIGGVEIVTYWRMFQQGNVNPLTPEWFALVRYTLNRAHELDMDVALTFTEAGWSFGGSWVPPEDRSKVLTRSWVDLHGPAIFRGPLPRYRVPPVDPVTPKVEPWRPNPASD